VSERPKAISLLAGAMIAIGVIGVVVNGYGFASQDPAYPPHFWLLFVALKASGIVGGVLLLQMRRIGVWWSLGSFALGIPVALLATGSVPAWQWAAAIAITALFLGAGIFAVRGHWHQFRPLGQKSGS
jgi:hypothetical protein